MQYDQKQFTQKGLDMFSSALSNKQSITVDKVIVDDLPTNNFNNLALLSMDSFADAMSFQANYTETSNNTLTVDAVMSNKGFQSPYIVQEIGLVGHVGDDTSNQSLMAILVASDPFTLPAQQNDETPSQFIPNITIQLANNDMGQVPVLVQDDAYIAQKDLDKLVADNGYIKLNDADNRYVKQTDFQNEVNNSVNKKADKSDLNTTNGIVSSLQSNKADKGDVNGQINQTLSQATAHSDQNLSTANSHSDSNYNDLSNKNNILSSRIDGLSQYHNSGSISNGYGLNGYSWNGSFVLKGVDLSTLSGNEGLPLSYTSFWGVLKVETMGGFTRQHLYDNLGMEWYRYLGNSSTWKQVATDDDLQNKTNDLSNQTTQQFNQANAHTDEVAHQLNSLDITNQDGKLMHAGKPLLTANAPNAPSLSLSIDSNNGNIQYTITPPSIDGGASITGYTLYYVIEGNSNWQSIPLGTDNLSGEFPATQSQKYEAYAITHNYAGDSPSSITEYILAASVPTINNLTVTNAYPNGLQYNVDANGNGATVTNYTIYYAKTNYSNWQAFSSSSNNGNITNIDTNNNYSVYVETTNIVGSSNSTTEYATYFNNTNLDYGINSIIADGNNNVLTDIRVIGNNIDWNSLYPNVKQIGIYATQYYGTTIQKPTYIINKTGNYSVANIINSTVFSVNSISNQTQNIPTTSTWTMNNGNIAIQMIAQGLDSNGIPLGIYTSVYMPNQS